MKIKILLVLATAILSVTSVLLIYKDELFPVSHSTNSVVGMRVPDSLRAELHDALSRKYNIVGIQVITVHFQRNIRIDTLTIIDNPVVQELYDRYSRNRVIEVPFFSNDVENNRRSLRLINGEFVCSPFLESVPGKLVPAAGTHIKTMCAIGIPPHHHGEFTGILTIYLNAVPDKAELDVLFLLSRDFSTRIYDANMTPNVFRIQS